jgi:hypothetical protein
MPVSVQQNGPLYKKIREMQSRRSITSRFLRLKGPEDETFGIGKLREREIIIERLFNK